MPGRGKLPAYALLGSTAFPRRNVLTGEQIKDRVRSGR